MKKIIYHNWLSMLSYLSVNSNFDLDEKIAFFAALAKCKYFQIKFFRDY